MATFLKVLGYIFTFIALVGGTQLMAREGINGITISVELIYILVAVLCFWGANKLKKKNGI